jgi:hypothetical protein
MIEKVKAALSAAGCIDVDAAIVIGDLGQLADAGAVDAAVSKLKEGKAYLFNAAPASEKSKSALDMTDAEYAAAKRNFALNGTGTMRPPRADFGAKKATEMTDAEYQEWRRKNYFQGRPLG